MIITFVILTISLTIFTKPGMNVLFWLKKRIEKKLNCEKDENMEWFDLYMQFNYCFIFLMQSHYICLLNNED